VVERYHVAHFASDKPVPDMPPLPGRTPRIFTLTFLVKHHPRSAVPADAAPNCANYVDVLDETPRDF
jgi:hypothetical protein